MDNTIILGGGLTGCCLAHFLNEKTLILEKEERIGGLCRSYSLNEITYDIGPHALFSKNNEILSRITSLVQAHSLRRSNKIFYNGRFIKYPFENELSALDDDERAYCLQEFLSNPYEGYPPENMLQFFLKTFGEGITRLYLQPYNEKIWKFDPSFMDLQMVERIPKPPKEDVIKSARGIETEGYTHQLYFYYPESGGIEQLIHSLVKRSEDKSTFVNPVTITSIAKKGSTWSIKTDQGTFEGKRLINCMPLHELCSCLDTPPSVQQALDALLFNSIHIVILQTKEDRIGNNFALYCADSDVIFHRLSKINFLGEHYRLKNGGSTIMAEITYRPGSYLETISPADIQERVLNDLDRLGLVHKTDVFDCKTHTFTYAYVIYDLHHRKNTDIVLDYLRNQGIHCCGRFAEFEYINMDAVFERSLRLAEALNGDKDD